VEINCDLGEVDTLEMCQQQNVIMPWIDRCNISCGSHAGSLEVADETLQLASKNQIKIGAHPGYADREHFGRLSLNQPFEQTLKSISQQLADFSLIAASHHVVVEHIKLHGALYNDVESNAEFAHRYVELIQNLAQKNMLPNISLLGLAGGELQKAVNTFNMGKSNEYQNRRHNTGVRLGFIAEAFVDRAYLSDGQLASRSLAGAVHADLDLITQQTQKLISGKAIRTLDGSQCVIGAESICVHGDRDDALEIVKAVRQCLSLANSTRAEN
jgi:5-oxoprolinase (ATP-hydrolysing) subunit A